MLQKAPDDQLQTAERAMMAEWPGWFYVAAAIGFAIAIVGGAFVIMLNDSSPLNRLY